MPNFNLGQIDDVVLRILTEEGVSPTKQIHLQAGM